MSEPKSRTNSALHGINSQCKVCGDRASGKHYGVPSCDGCRGFFKRSIRRNLEYTCKEGGKCIVDVSRRNQCQACRFAKCLQANMRPEAVQHERAPRSCIPNSHLTAGLIGDPKGFPIIHQIPLHHAHNRLFLPMPIHLPAAFSSGVNLESSLSRHYSHFNAFHPNVLDSLHFAAANGNLLAPPPPPPPPPIIPSDTAATEPSIEPPDNTVSHAFHAPNAFKATAPPRNESHIFRANLFQMPGTFPNLPQHNKDGNGKEDEVSSSEEILTLHSLASTSTAATHADQDIIFESAARLLILTVKWVRSIPSFNQLNTIDQNILLEECWAELFIIMSAQYGLPIANLTMCSNDSTIQRLHKAIQQILLLRLNHTEIACLKTLTLFRHDCVGLTSPYEIAVLQDDSLNLLIESCGTGTRMGHILLTLPYIRSAADRKIIQELLFKRTVGEVAIEKLLGELMRN